MARLCGTRSSSRATGPRRVRASSSILFSKASKYALKISTSCTKCELHGIRRSTPERVLRQNAPFYGQTKTRDSVASTPQQTHQTPTAGSREQSEKGKNKCTILINKRIKVTHIYYNYIFWRRGDLLIRASCWTVATARFGFFLSASNSVPSIIISRPSKRGDLRVVVSGVVTGRI